MQLARHHADVQILGGVLNQSHFVCSSCSTEHELFGSSQAFDAAAKELSFDVLGRIPLDPGASKQGDAGRPIVLSDATSTSGDAAALRSVADLVAAKIGL